MQRQSDPKFFEPATARLSTAETREAARFAAKQRKSNHFDNGYATEKPRRAGGHHLEKENQTGDCPHQTKQWQGPEFVLKQFFSAFQHQQSKVDSGLVTDFESFKFVKHELVVDKCQG